MSIHFSGVSFGSRYPAPPPHDVTQNDRLGMADSLRLGTKETPAEKLLVWMRMAEVTTGDDAGTGTGMGLTGLLTL